MLIQPCDYCEESKIYFWVPYHKKYNIRKCQTCLEGDVALDGRLEITRLGELVEARLVFREELFANVCKGYMWFPGAVLDLGYKQLMINFESDRVHLYYEPPTIRKLKGLGRLESALPKVKAKILLAIMRQSIVETNYADHKGHKRA